MASLNLRMKRDKNHFVSDDRDKKYLTRPQRPRYFVNSLAKGLSLLQAFVQMDYPNKTQSILKTLKFKPLTARTIIHLDKFIEELDSVRKKGYAINDEELSIGNRAIAAPIMDKHGYAAAAINIAMPTAEYSHSLIEYPI
jgi:hypothetical protein